MRIARASNAALWAIIVILGILACATGLLPTLRGWQAVALTGQSMVPTYEMGSLVYVDPSASPDVGDIVTFDRNNRLWTHRIVQQTHALESFDLVRYQTKGDNPNLANDPFLVAPEDIRGVAVASIPYVGYADLYLKQPMGWATIGAIALLLVFLSKKPTERQ